MDDPAALLAASQPDRVIYGSGPSQQQLTKVKRVDWMEMDVIDGTQDEAVRLQSLGVEEYDALKSKIMMVNVAIVILGTAAEAIVRKRSILKKE